MNDLKRQDVGDLYTFMNKAYEIGDFQTLRDVKLAGIELGHAGVLDRAVELLGTEATESELARALKNAVAVRGFSIDDACTSVGSLYQRLFGNNFSDYGIGFKSEELFMPYEQLPREMKDLLNVEILRGKGFVRFVREGIDYAANLAEAGTPS